MTKPPKLEPVFSLFETEEVVATTEEQQRPHSAPPDAAERSRALDPTRSFLVQAPAGSGKTHLLTQRFLRLLGQAEKPDEIVAITFTNAAAAEMRSRILDELEEAEKHSGAVQETLDLESLRSLAHRALARDRQFGWRILDQPGQLRITTIDAFCRSLALQSPLNWGQLSGLGGRLEPTSNPRELYHRAAAGLMNRLLREELLSEKPTRGALEALMLWRDNNWNDVEELIVKMLGERNRWYQDFVFARNPDWKALRKRLEAPFCRSAQQRLENLADLLDEHPDGRERMTDLARFACGNGGKSLPEAFREREHLLDLLVTKAEFKEIELLHDAVEIHRALADFLLTDKKAWRKTSGLTLHNGFPTTDEGKAAKTLFGRLTSDLEQVIGLQEALADLQRPMPTCYTEDEWQLIKHSFAILRAAAVELQLVFAETGSVDFTEVSQIALRILAPENGFPSDFAIRQADSIHHLLVDEFQDTSRNQHQLLSRLIAAWPDRAGRSCFCVGDPMQSIYGFREAEVELFERLKTHGLEMTSPDSESGLEAIRFDFVALRANFRTAPSLVDDLNLQFEEIFAKEDGSGVEFSPAVAARSKGADYLVKSARAELHLAFTAKKCPPTPAGTEPDPVLAAGDPERTREVQLAEIVDLIKGKLRVMAEIRESIQQNPEKGSGKFRIAILGRTRKSLILIADALRREKIGYRAIELVPLADRQEVLDALSLSRALLNPADRTAWLGVLRAPWCGLSLEELHLLVSSDDSAVVEMAVPLLLENRLNSLQAEGRLSDRAFAAAARVHRVMRRAVELRAESSSIALGSWLESVWFALGGEDTVNAEQYANLRLLWAALDQLPGGELDLLGPALPAALTELCALPDPAASSNFGVQLMTIHKSKGLEFEVVIVPDLEAEGQKYERDLMSWLERGIARGIANSETTELTEFLIAPIQPKGEKAGVAKKWVDEVKRERNQQELRRLLYVAATRAREELHLFARPRFSLRKGTVAGSTAEPVLDKASGLLATAWPAFSAPVETRFADWVTEIGQAAATDLETLAAQAEEDDIETASAGNGAGKILQLSRSANGALVSGQVTPARPVRATLLRRLPEDYAAPEFRLGGASHGRSSSSSAIDQAREPLYQRKEGSLQSRLEGIAIHALLERLGRIRESEPTLDGQEATRQLRDALPGIVATLRGRGLAIRDAERLASDALAIVQRCSTDPVGNWIFAPHLEADVEARWTGILNGGERNLRPDRVFLSSRPAFLIHGETSQPAMEDSAAWWIIDYKSSFASESALENPASRHIFLKRNREQYTPQLALYAELLRKLKHEEQSKVPPTIYTGIYYPRLQLFDFWLA